MTAAQIIREARLKAELTQTQLAERLGRERAQVARWEIGGQEPSFANVVAVVEACGFELNFRIAERQEDPELDAELRTSVLQAPSAAGAGANRASRRPDVSNPRDPFDPYAILEALEAGRIGYVVVGAFARVVHGSGETTSGIDVTPSLRDQGLGRLARTLEALGGRS